MIHTDLVRITPATHNVDIFLAYATKDNITGNPIYQTAECYLHKTAEDHLKKAILLAEKLGLRIKIFDAFRPLEAQKILWDHFQDPNYISNPETGSIPHCRGVAIDLTLINEQGQELDMGTGFDHLGKEAHHGYTDLSTEAIRNRLLLMGLMTTAGWDFFRNEWWHYQLFNARSFTVFTDKEAKTNLISY